MKKTFLAAILILVTCSLFAQVNDSGSLTNNTVVQGSVGLGTVIAVVASWSRNQSILWAILHGILGWLYVVYFALTRENDE